MQYKYSFQAACIPHRSCILLLYTVFWKKAIVFYGGYAIIGTEKHCRRREHMEQYRDKYREIRQRLMELTERDRNIRAVIAFGSSTRDAEKADVYSDLDLMIIT